uniref:Capsid protein n=1 Tax=Wenzhou levi-like virus 6 TaxID=1923572 RepID=A0A1L3KIQ7_9VIRU|nr:hypothetical protein [Wenzhou levi-like virus 6]
MSISTKNAANVAVVYNPYRIEGNRAIYIGAAHSDLIKDQIILTSASPKQTPTSYGNRRTSLNVVNTISVDTPQASAVGRDMKLEALASVPTGATLGEFKELAARLAFLLQQDDFVQSLYMTGQIDH